MENRSDRELMRLIGRKDREALKMLYKRYEVKIFNFILKMTGNRGVAQELIQETFIKIWFSAYTFDQQMGNAKAWLYTIALNLTRNEMRKKEYSYRFVTLDEFPDVHGHVPHDNGPEQSFEKREMKNLIAGILGKMKPFLREVVVLKNFQGLKFREIAEITRLPESTLKARYLRAIEQLKANLAKPEV